MQTGFCLFLENEEKALKVQTTLISIHKQNTKVPNFPELLFIFPLNLKSKKSAFLLNEVICLLEQPKHHLKATE